MKFTQILCQQRIGWHLKQLWKVKSRRQVLLTRSEKILKEKGINVENANEVVNPKKPFEPYANLFNNESFDLFFAFRIEIVGMYTKAPPLDEHHPKWKARPCLTFKDDNVLLEGLNQAQNLTNTAVVQNRLPENIVLPELSKEINQKASRAILGSHVLDGEQVKLPKVIDPLRPAFGFRRDYGISEQRVK